MTLLAMSSLLMNCGIPSSDYYLLGHIGDLLARSLRFATPPLLTDPDIQERFSPLPRKSDERRFLSSLPADLCSIGHL